MGDDRQNLHEAIRQLYGLRDADTFGIKAISIVDRLLPSDLPIFHQTYIRSDLISSTFSFDRALLSPEIRTILDRQFGEGSIVYARPDLSVKIDRQSNLIARRQSHCLEGLDRTFSPILNIRDRLNFFMPHPVTSRERLESLVDNISIGFSLDRIQTKFTEGEKSIFSILQIHLLQAHTNICEYARLGRDLQQLQQSLDDLGAIVLDRQGKIVNISPQAAIWLEIYFQKLTYDDRLPESLWLWISDRINDRDRASFLRTYLPLHVRSGDRELIVRPIVKTDCERYLLLLEERKIASQEAIEALGLSQREIDVLSLVMQGKDNQEIAQQLSIYVSTVRKHLENIYRKLAVSSRSAAIAKILETIGVLHF